jgi:hypothetical protein
MFDRGSIIIEAETHSSTGDTDYEERVLVAIAYGQKQCGLLMF